MNINAELIASFNKLNMKHILSVKNMVDGKDYPITGAERVTTKYGDLVVLELDGVMLYLPKRFNALTENDVGNLSTGSYIISKIPLDNEKDSINYKLEIKTATTPMRGYYPYTYFNTFK